MNSFSFTSQEDHHEKHCLDQEIGLDQLGSWRDNSQERPGYEAQLDGVSEFDISMERRSNELSRSFSKQNSQPRELSEILVPSQKAQQYLQAQQKEPRQTCQNLLPNNKDQQLISQATAEQQNEIKQGESCPQLEAATFFQQSNPSETVVRDSILQQKWQNSNGTVLNEFAYMNDHVYNPLLNNFRTILEKTKIYSDKSVSNLDMYCLFFRIKLEQEQKRCLNMQNGKSKLAKMFSNNLLLDEVYLNQKSVVREMTKRTNYEADRLAAYCQPLQQASTKIKNLLSKTLQSRKKQTQNIQTQLQNIIGIQNEINHLVTHPPSLQNSDNWFGKGDMRSDRYLQRRYLVDRQHLFLDLLQNTGDKLVTLLNSIFVKEEPVIHALITKEMERYRKLSDEFYGKTEKQSLVPSKKISPCDFNSEIFDILRGIIPKEWYEASRQELHSTESLVEELNNYLDDQIFLSSIQIDNSHILFTAEAKWITQNSQHQQHSPKPQQISIIQANEAYNSPSNTQSPGQSPTKKNTSNMAINVILTVDKYLHMECGQKIASLKLKKLKLSRKGKAIQVSERNHSITNLFTSAIIFGELLFAREEDAQKFIAVILSQK